MRTMWTQLPHILDRYRVYSEGTDEAVSRGTDYGIDAFFLSFFWMPLWGFWVTSGGVVANGCANRTLSRISPRPRYLDARFDPIPVDSFTTAPAAPVLLTGSLQPMYPRRLGYTDVTKQARLLRDLHSVLPTEMDWHRQF